MTVPDGSDPRTTYDPTFGGRVLFVACPECGRTFNLNNEMDADEWSNGHDCEVIVAYIDSDEIGSHALQGPDYSMNHGGADLLGILAGLIALACLFALMFLSTNPAPKVLPVSAYEAVPTAIATTQAPPVTPQGASIPPVVVTAPKIDRRPATAIVTTTAAPSGEVLAAPAVHLSCEVLADGQDTVAGNGTPGWYRQGIDSDVVAANPDHVRNCTPAVTP